MISQSDQPSGRSACQVQVAARQAMGTALGAVPISISSRAISCSTEYHQQLVRIPCEEPLFISHDGAPSFFGSVAVRRPLHTRAVILRNAVRARDLGPSPSLGVCTERALAVGGGRGALLLFTCSGGRADEQRSENDTRGLANHDPLLLCKWTRHDALAAIVHSRLIKLDTPDYVGKY
jgi:hypothetical protein